VLAYERFKVYGLAAAQPISALLIAAVLVVLAILRLVMAPERSS